MIDNQSKPNVGEAVVVKSKRISVVWFIPVIALVLGAWLVYRHNQDQGPLIEVSFNDAAGLEVDNTKIKFKDVELGAVTNIRLSDDISGVIVSARMAKESVPFLNDNAKFWVVKPRVGTGAISGLNTLLRGSHIALDSQAGGTSSKFFTGLDAPPPRTQSAAGRKIVLETDTTYSLSIGSPVYYRQFRVGEIDSVSLKEDFSTVRIEAFIEAPFDELIHESTSFWNVSGVKAELTSQGASLQLQSLESLFLGGIAFETPQPLSSETANLTNVVFNLHENRDALDVKSYGHKEYFVLNFDQSIRGLKVGAPVSYRGLEMGQVTQIDTHLDEQGELFIPITIAIERERLGLPYADQNDVEKKAEFEELVKTGLRAKLQTGNLLTGQLYVTLDFYPETEFAQAQYFQDLPEIPTISTDLEKIAQNVGDVVAKINNLDVETLVNNINETVVSIQGLVDVADTKLADALDNLNLTLSDTRQLISDADDKVVGVIDSLGSTLKKSQTLIDGLDEGSVTRHELNELMKEIQQAARSVRRLTETIERNPNSLIFGKPGSSENQ